VDGLVLLRKSYYSSPVLKDPDQRNPEARIYMAFDLGHRGKVLSSSSSRRARDADPRQGGQDLDERIVIGDARAESAAVLDRLEARCRASSLDLAILLDLRVIAEEVLTNIAKYAFAPGTSAAAEVVLSLTATEAVLEFRDEGRAFDPLSHPAPDLDAPVSERPVGGLGLPLVRALVDEARYVREGGTNVLRLVKRRPAQ
jgi:anti-sigma regulatory factor (Ser/Thr protein kinase)